MPKVSWEEAYQEELDHLESLAASKNAGVVKMDPKDRQIVAKKRLNILKQEGGTGGLPESEQEG